MSEQPDPSMTMPSPDLRPAVTADGPSGRRPFQFWAQGVLAASIVVLTFYTLGRFRLSLVGAAVLAIVFWPLQEWLARRWTSRHAPTLIPFAIVTAILLVVVLPVSALIAACSHEAHNGIEWFRQARENGIPKPPQINHLPWGSAQIGTWWDNNLQSPENVQRLLAHIRPERALGPIEHVGHSVVSGTVIFGFALLILFFLLRAGHPLIGKIDLLSWRALGPRGHMAQRQLVGAVRGAMTGLVLVGLGEGVIIGIAYLLAGAPQPLLLALFTGLASMIPMLGGVAVAVSVVVIIVTGSLGAAIAVGIFGAIVLFAADHFVRPVLIGGSIRLPFVWVLLGILGGLETWGILGLFIGPVLLALAHLLWRFGSGRAAGVHGGKPIP